MKIRKYYALKKGKEYVYGAFMTTDIKHAETFESEISAAGAISKIHNMDDNTVCEIGDVFEIVPILKLEWD